MKTRPILTGVLAGALVALAGPAAAAEPGDVEIGRSEYIHNCASCHGRDGRGGGPMAEHLTKKPFDLTRLSAGNGGRFPFFEVFEVIQGSRDVPAHGDREMPVWGARFRADALTEYNRFSPDSPEEMAQGRILRLVYYLRTLQRD